MLDDCHLRYRSIASFPDHYTSRPIENAIRNFEPRRTGRQRTKLEFVPCGFELRFVEAPVHEFLQESLITEATLVLADDDHDLT